jgi:hypothetical protein
MTASTSTGELSDRWAYVDWNELSNLDRIVAVYDVGENSIVVETTDGREVRISAWRNRSTGQYVADFERRGTLIIGGQPHRLWEHTPAYARCTGNDVASCLEAAVLEVERVHVY